MAITFFDCTAFMVIQPLRVKLKVKPVDTSMQFGLLQSTVLEMLQNRKEALWKPHHDLSCSLSTQQASNSAPVTEVFFDGNFVVGCGQ